MAKRIFDLSVSIIFLVLFAPFYLLIAVLIKLDSSGPVHYQALRVGKNGRFFKLLKFRTMKVNSSNLGPAITQKRDPRITRTGKVLREIKFDEIPQLWNVIRGDMSLVGPRPEDPRYVEKYDEEQRKVLLVKPGLSSPASIQYRHEEKLLSTQADNLEEYYVRQVMPKKLKIDLDYVENQSLIRDVAICFKTAYTIFKPNE
jgi:lipopolysaccharide/colanic/teichoic acid biosynthesis glycosyltransferase